MLPTVLAEIVGATSADAGFIGLGVLFTLGASLCLLAQRTEPPLPPYHFVAPGGSLTPSST